MADHHRLETLKNHDMSATVGLTLTKFGTVNKDVTFGYHPVGAPTCYTNRRWGNPAGTQHNPANDDLRG